MFCVLMGVRECCVYVWVYVRVYMYVCTY